MIVGICGLRLEQAYPKQESVGIKEKSCMKTNCSIHNSASGKIRFLEYRFLSVIKKNEIKKTRLSSWTEGSMRPTSGRHCQWNPLSLLELALHLTVSQVLARFPKSTRFTLHSFPDRRETSWLPYCDLALVEWGVRVLAAYRQALSYLLYLHQSFGHAALRLLANIDCFRHSDGK